MFISCAAVSIPPRSIRLHSPLVESAHCPALSNASARIIPATRQESFPQLCRRAHCQTHESGALKLPCRESGSALARGTHPIMGRSDSLLPPIPRPEAAWISTSSLSTRRSTGSPRPRPRRLSGRPARLPAGVRSSARVGVLRRIRIVVFDSRIAEMEPLATGHAAHWPQADCRHKPVQACAVGPVKCMAFAARAGKRGR